MHSSRMHTARLLSVSPSIHCSGEGTCPGSVPGPREVCTCSQGEGCTWSWEGGTWSQGGVPGPRGVPGSGCVLVPGGGTWSRGVYLVPGGVPGPAGVYLVRESVPAQILPPHEQNDRQVQNYCLAPNFIGGQ